jgi:hypothetical protein
LRIRLLILILLFLSGILTTKAQIVDGSEKYDKSLARLNSIEKLNAYIDSCVRVQNIEALSKEEIFLVNEIIEQKFYHGYSHYSFENNWIAYLTGKYIWDHLSAIVIPDDLVKHGMAACSQQAIVMMEILKQRGFEVRKLGLTGHFILEAFYDKEWHIFDPNKEPEFQGASHDSLDTFLNNGYLTKAYSAKATPEAVKKMFSNRQVGQVNEFPAKNARLFHWVTGSLSKYFIRLFFLSILGVSFIIKKLERNRTKKQLLTFSAKEKTEVCVPA